MRTELPKKWCVKIETIKNYPEYASFRNINMNNQWIIDNKNYYLFSNNNPKCSHPQYVSMFFYKNYTEITLVEFERLVLNKSTEPNYEIY